MTDEGRFTPRLGRPGDHPSLRPQTHLKRLVKAVRKGQLPRRAGGELKAGTVRYLGSGKAAAAHARHWSHARQRRAIVKVHIARAGQAGTAAFAKHLAYIHRDGTERDGARSVPYDQQGELPDTHAFRNRSRDDARQFRLIVSPEDAGQIGDLKAFTRSLMAQAEKDLGRPLDWIAVDHHDTAHSHTHIVIRGGNAREGALIIDRAYLTEGFRRRAAEELTRRLGQRRLREIAASRTAEVARDAFTAIDRELHRIAPEGDLVLTQARGPLERFDEAVKVRRLAHLQARGLARHLSGSRWTLTPGWTDTLRALGTRGDIIAALARQSAARSALENLREFPARAEESEEITGRLAAVLPGDELRNGRVALVEGLDGRLWSVPVPEHQQAELPPIGGVLSVGVAAHATRPADITVARIAEANNGHYSEALHAAADPGSSPAYRMAHKRRLEALRRQGVVTRQRDGRWGVPPDFLEKVRELETRTRKLTFAVRSWLPVEALTKRRASTWLDRLDPADLQSMAVGFGAETRAAHAARQAWLQAEGLHLVPRDSLSRTELEAALSAEGRASGKAAALLTPGQNFKGRFTRTVDLAQGRFAVVENEDQLVLAPWSARTSGLKGQDVLLRQRGQSIDWQAGRGTGQSR